MDLTKEQEALETKGILDGILRYRRQQQDRPLASSSPAQRILSENVPKVAEAIYKLQLDLTSGKPGHRFKEWGSYLLTLDADYIAAIALIVALNSNETSPTVTRLSLDIGSQLELEYKFRLLRRQAPDLFRFYESQVKKWNSRRARFFLARIRKFKDVWPKKSKVHVGAALLKFILDNTKLFEMKRYNREGKTHLVIELTDESWDYLEDLHKDQETWNPLLPPMLVPPIDWDIQNKRGGYLRLTPSLVKRDPALKNRSGPINQDSPCLVALNHVQATPFKINTYILDVLLRIKEEGGNLGDIPPLDMVPLPPKPSDMDTNPEAVQKWKIEATGVYDRNARIKGRRKDFLLRLATAQRFRDKVIYFPHSFDWRGRIYPLPIYLNPQVEDSGRALLLFANPKPLGETGWKWLLIHAANCYGYDKVSLTDRYKWAEEHLSIFQQFAEYPFEFTEWEKADKPFLFLAVCKEISEAIKSGDKLGYRSRIPVSIDGSCNGLQHYSAIGRDAIGGKSVNLVSSETPADVYSEVGNLVYGAIQSNEKLGSEREQNDASIWLSCLSDQDHRRKVIKRPVMTYPYGVTYFRIIRNLIDDGFTDELDGDANELASYLTKFIWEAIPKVVKAAVVYMNWLQSVAKQMSAIAKPIIWTTPSGFTCCQDYRNYSHREVKTLLAAVYLRIPMKDDPINKLKQRTALAPNFIHSMDATHMSFVVCEAAKAGIKDYMMIHDSYATHACDIDILSRITREEFVRLYSQDVLGDFIKQLETRNETELPPRPPQGDLDIKEVLKSEYFFN